MATTTNYSWTTPDDTALVKDGAAAIRSLGTAIDTTVYNNASAAIPKTLIDAKGDLIVGSAADTAARLAAGTNGYLLSANSGATNGVEWVAPPTSGGMTLLSTTTLSGSTTTTATISGTYNTLLAVIYGVNNASNSIIKCLPNASAGNCYGARITQPGNAIAQFANSDIFITNGTIYANDASNSCSIYFHNFQTTTPISFSVAGGYRDATSNNQTGVGSWGQWLGGAAITSLQFTNTAGTFTAGTVLLYGVK